MKEDLLKGLTEEQIAKVKACKNSDELLALATVDADVTLELDALQSISNSAQKALIKTQQMMDRLKRGTLTLTKLPNEIAENFQKSGISGALMIE